MYLFFTLVLGRLSEFKDNKKIILKSNKCLLLYILPSKKVWKTVGVKMNYEGIIKWGTEKDT